MAFPRISRVTLMPIARVHAAHVAVLGDLHLARPGSAACASVSAEAFTASVRALLETSEWVVLNGDLFDLERGPLPWRQAHELLVIEPAHAHVDVLHHPRVIWLSGNHDHVLHRQGRAQRALDLVTPAGLVRIEHGDRFNAPIKRSALIASGVTWLSGRMQGPALAPVYRAMKLAERVLAGESREGEGPGAVERNAARWLAAHPEYVGLVIGHTHRRYEEAVDDAWLLNPGDSMSTVRAVRLDGHAGTLAWSWEP